jgi:type VI secretion system VasD/TssJ family lipoprotein
MMIEGGKSLNLAADGRPLPTIIRIYLLKGTTQMDISSPDDLQRGDREFLGGEFVDAREITLRPDSREEVTFERPEAVTHLAFVALFREPQGSAWRNIQKLPAEDPLHCHRRKNRPTGRYFNVVVDSSRIASSPY